MKKLLVGTILFSALLIASPALGAVTYDRTPLSPTVTSPVTISVAFDDFNTDFSAEGACDGADCSWWGIGVIPVSNVAFRYTDGCFASTTKSHIATIALPAGEYESVLPIIGRTQVECEALAFDGGIYFEGPDPTAFWITAGYNILPMSDAPTSILSWIGGLFTDVRALILLAVGLPLGFWLIKKVIKMGSGKRA